jgi:hypothetical protein
VTDARRSSAGPAALALALALLPAAACAGQGLSFAWDLGISTSGEIADRGGGAELKSRDLVAADLRLEREFASGTLTLAAGADFAYAPQDLAAGAPRSEAFLAYPAAFEAAWESAPGLVSDPWFRIELGRVEAREPSGLLLRDPEAPRPDQAMDGLVAQLRLGGLYASVGAGYLGLLDKRQNRVRATAADAAELSVPDRYWAPPRALAIFRIEAERLFLGQDLGLLGIMQKDLREGTETRDDWYVGAVARGPVADRLRHSETAIVSISAPSGGSTYAGILSRAELSCALPWKPLGEARLAALWAGGWGGSFPGLAGPAASLVYDAPPRDLVAVELGADAALAPPPIGARLGASLALRALFVPLGGVESGYSFATAGSFLGVETELDLLYEPIYGFVLAARGGFLASPGGLLPRASLEARIEL